MRKLVSAFAITLAIPLAVACGGSGGDDGGGDVPDAAPPGIDADNRPPVTGLGEVCNLAAPTCGGGATVCVTLEMGAPTEGFCTVECGTGPAGVGMDQPMPPAGGDAICAGAYMGTTGTPACALFGPPDANMIVTWACGIACGNVNGTELGDCPGGMTCNAMNFCTVL